MELFVFTTLIQLIFLLVSSSPSTTTLVAANSSAPTPSPILNDGRVNYTYPPSSMPTVFVTETTVIPDCDRDDGCTSSPTINPIISPTLYPTIVPTTVISPNTTNNGGSSGSNLGDTEYSWNDPIVLAVGLLGAIVLILTGMVSIFACMAYSKSKENMRIADKLRVSMMRDNSHSNENNNGNGGGHGRYQMPHKSKPATDYRNVQSTDILNGEDQKEDIGPGSMPSQNEARLTIDNGSNNSNFNNFNNQSSPVVLIEMGKGNKQGGQKIQGESLRGSVANNLNDINNKQENNNDNNNDDDNDNNLLPNNAGGAYVTPQGVEHVSTDEVIASVQDEGAGSAYGYGIGKKIKNDVPNLQEVASVSKDTKSNSNSKKNNNDDESDFIKGLNNAMVANVFAEDDVVQHMSTAGGAADDNNNDNNGNNNNDDDDDERNRGASIQLEFGI